MPGAKAGDGKVFKFVGDAAEGGDQAEPNLDIQYIMGPAPGIATEFWAFAARTGEDLCSQIVNFTNTMLTGVDQPVVFSLSWGLPSPVPHDMCSASGVQVVDTNVGKVLAHGPSPVPGSSLAAWSSAPPPRLWPVWPASSPWVTAVGATRFVNQTAGKPEMAADTFGSGGGFSGQFPQSPDAAWPNTSPPSARPRCLPRAPSIPRATRRRTSLCWGKAPGHHRWRSHGARWHLSASAPVFAAVASLLNQARLAQGSKQMGFLNPFLYANADAFTSINLGSDKFIRNDNKQLDDDDFPPSLPLPYGFNCTQG